MDRVRTAVEAIRGGGMVIVLDDADRENEADLVMAAEHASARDLGFMLRHTSGIVCAPMTGAWADRLALPPMVPANTDRHGTAFTVSVDVLAGTGTGISATDRALTLRALADPSAVPADFARPGHVFPLRARAGGVLARPGHTEAAVDLVTAAGLAPVAVISELTTPDGEPLRAGEATRLAAEHGLPILTVRELVAWRSVQSPGAAPEAGAVEVAAARLPTRYGEFAGRVLRTGGAEHLALVLGDVTAGEVPVRLHSECWTGDVVGSLRCDCGDQLDAALREIARHGAGVLVYQVGHEGRGIGLAAKMAAYALQDRGYDTVDANLRLGLPVDARDFTGAADVLRALGVRRVRLLTNNPGKVEALRANGYPGVRRQPLLTPRHADNVRYLEAKRRRLGHQLPAERTERVAERTERVAARAN